LKKHISCIKIQKSFQQKYLGHTIEEVVINCKKIFYKNFIKEEKVLKGVIV
jgi:hypothetical protein